MGKFKDMVWNMMFNGDMTYILDKIDIDEHLAALEIKYGEINTQYSKLLLDLEKLKQDNDTLSKYVENEVQQDELEKYWNTKRPKQNIMYNGRIDFDDDRKRIPIDVRIFLNKLDVGVPVVSGETNDEKANNCLKYVAQNITYTTDIKGSGEYWQFAYETLSRKKGDCEDGAILLANMALRSGIPYWRIRLNAGDVQGGGHCYVTYLRESDNQWYVLDWCYWFNESVDFQRSWASAEKYFGIWFSWNEKYSFGQTPKEQAYNSSIEKL